MGVTVSGYEVPVSHNAFVHAETACAELDAGSEAEVLRFLAERPIHTVFMATLIRESGLVSPNNRGTFYSWRNRLGQLEGVGLIGHATMIETRSEHALTAFAQLAGRSRDVHLIRGERKTVDNFWKHYAATGQSLRLTNREMMCLKTQDSAIFEPVKGLRRARISDLEQVMAINAFMAFEEGGVNPYQRDPLGFRRRQARRIEQGRIWIWVRDGKPIFKADIVGDTPEMIYLEGIHVHPHERAKGYGQRCLAQLSSILLRRAQSICLTVNQSRADAVAFYAKSGFDFHSEYETIYLS